MFRCVILIAVFFICAPNASHALKCEAPLTSTGNQQLKYQARDEDRCEGLFFQPVAASAHIRIIAFFDDLPAFSEPLNAIIPLVALGATSENHISFRAVSARYRQYFRMDATADSAGRFAWKTDIVKALNLAPKELMVLGCDGGCDLAQPRLLPISGLSDHHNRTKTRSVIFTSAVDLSKVLVELTDVSRNRTIEKEHDLLEGQILPAGSLKPYYGLIGKTPGLYRIKLTAIPRYNNDTADQTQTILQIPTD
jgi:hypothetical protein